jgi:hypothetical protein
LEPEFIWTSTVPTGDASPVPSSIASASEEPQEDMDWGPQVDTVDSFTDYAAASDMLGLDLGSNAPHPSKVDATFECSQELLKAQRVMLQQQHDSCLFRPIKGIGLASDSVVPWKPWSSLEIIVWPLCIAHVHGDTRITSLLSMLSKRYSICLEDILLVCSYSELDLSLTIDLGLRYAEDALWLWVVLQGTIVDDCLLDVYPLKALKGAGHTLDLSGVISSAGHDSDRIR